MTALATDSGRKTPARLAGSAILACQSDERLVKLVRSGHERAFDAIVQRYRKQLVRWCGRILPESRCEDAVQQAFINAHAALISSDDDVQLKPWLFAITRNAALNMLRQNGWNYEQIPLDFDGVRRPDQVFEQSFELQQTVAALNDLPERQRNALVMREFEGRSYDEIALALGANDGAVRQLLNRARVTLRNAAAFLTPPPLLARAAASMPQSDGRRAAEVVAGFGAAGIAKAGATALVAGSLVVGAVNGPLALKGSNKPKQQRATLVRTPAKHAAADKPVSLQRSTPVTHSNRGTSHHSGETEHSGSGRSGSSHENEHHGSRSSGSDDSGSTRERSSGSDDSSTRGRDDRSGSRGGSDDGVETTSASERGESSGSGTSGSSSSGSGTSGSSSETSESVTSGSGGSGTSGSGSDDAIDSGSTSGSSEPEH